MTSHISKHLGSALPALGAPAAQARREPAPGEANFDSLVHAFSQAPGRSTSVTSANTSQRSAPPSSRPAETAAEATSRNALAETSGQKTPAPVLSSTPTPSQTAAPTQDGFALTSLGLSALAAEIGAAPYQKHCSERLSVEAKRSCFSSM